MRKFRFYIDNKNLKENDEVRIPDSEINHIRNVLRLTSGDVVYIFNGESEFQAEILSLSKENATMKILQLVNSTHSDNNTSIDLYQALIRPKNLDLILEKTTELGVNKIIPFESDYSVIKLNHVLKKQDRWEKIVVNAAKQSERLDVPEIQNALSFSDMLNHILDQNYDFILVCEGRRESTIQIDDLKSKESIAVIIGPEGGFSPKELEIFQDKKFEFLKINSNILRAETAAISIVSILQFVVGQ